MTNTTLNLIAILLAVLVSFEVYDRGTLWYHTYTIETAANEAAANAQREQYYNQCVRIQQQYGDKKTEAEAREICEGVYGR